MNREREIEARVNAANLGKLVVVKKPRRTICDFEIIEEAGDDTGGICTCYAMEAASFIAAAPADIRYLLARVRELEEALEQKTREALALNMVYDVVHRRQVQYLTENFPNADRELNDLTSSAGSVLGVLERQRKQFAALEAALTPFAEVGAAVAARPAYPPTQELMRVGEASFTVAHLIAAADVLAVRAEAVTGGGVSKGGISEHGEKAT